MKFSNRAKGIYLLWITINFFLLIISGNITDLFIFGRGYSADKYFFPFDSIDIENSYDLTEFLLYTALPILVFVSYKLITTKKD
ncbi:hypothetical protein ACFL0J_04385 [Candidatus Neomarinimicrobiota bacterium]